MIDFENEALEYHSKEPAGKIGTKIKKELVTQFDLSVAYSPGVAGPCRLIAKDKNLSFKYTGRANLVGVITNGTAVLGLGNIGPEAAKPVMEGKAMLFKKFADIDVFDIEIASEDPDTFIAAVKALEPTFGGINLEDIKAPECFYIEEELKKCMKIPVFHDDQHGTAIIASAAFLNALEVTGRSIANTKVVFSGGGAAAVACANLFLEIGVKPGNLLMVDTKGVIYKGRTEGMNKYKDAFAVETSARSLEDAVAGADVFVGVSAPNILTEAALLKMAKDPIVFALSNPDPEIDPKLARRVRPDAIIATGRSDYPNQVNNVLGFPFIFRGALDVSATCVNKEMKLAAVYAIASLAKEDVPDVVTKVYSKSKSSEYTFGKEYLIPKPIDPRVLLRVAPAVAKAAMDSGVALRPIDIEEYKARIELIQGPTRKIIRRLRNRIHNHVVVKSGARPRIVIPDGYDPRVIRAVSQVCHDGEVALTLLGKKHAICEKAEQMGIADFATMADFIDPVESDLQEAFSKALFARRHRKGVALTAAKHQIRNHNYFAALLLDSGRMDGMITGLSEPYASAVRPILEIIGVEENQTLAGIYLITVDKKLYVFADCTINISPDAKTLANIALAAAGVSKKYNPDEAIKIAMLAFSSFGSSHHEECVKVAKSVEILRKIDSSLCVEGEMQADVALNADLQKMEFPFSALGGEANVLVFPSLSAANIAYKLLTNITDSARATGPILSGIKKPANVLQRSATVDEIIDMIYITAEQFLNQKHDRV